MSKNLVRLDADHQPVICSAPTTPVSGDPVRVGVMTGVALTDESTGSLTQNASGLASGYTAVDFGHRVWSLSVKGVDDSGNSAVAVNDLIYYVDGDTPPLSKKATGYFFGVARSAVNSGSTTTINVEHIGSPGSATIAAGSVTQAKIAANTLDDTVVSNVASSNVLGGIPLIYRIDVPDAATGDIDVVVTHKIRVIDVVVIKTTGAGGAANTVQVKNSGNAITDAIVTNIADQALARAGTIDDARYEIAAGGTLRVTRTKAGGNAACDVYVHAIRVS